MTVRAIITALCLILTPGVATAEQDLTPQVLLDGKVSLLIPTEFKQMDEEMLNLKYPSERRPTLVFTDARGAVNVAINHTNNALLPSQLTAALPQFKELFENLYPSAVWYRKERVEINGRDFIVFDLDTPAVDTTIRNIMMWTSLEGRMFLVTVNMTKELEGEWLAAAKRITASVKLAE